MTTASTQRTTDFVSAAPAGVPSSIWRTLSSRGKTRRKLPKGLDALWNTAVGSAMPLFKRTRHYIERSAKVMALHDEFVNLSDARLREQITQLRELFRRGRQQPQDVERGYAIVGEVVFRKMDIRPHAVQVAAALAMDDGCIIELATGEGKTLSATLPATLAGWRGRGCHVITVNDYLATRDAAWMKPIYEFLGLTVASIDGEMKPPERLAAYNADITYCTNKEVAADFLRDRLSLGRLQGLSAALLSKIADGAGSGTDRMVMRGLDTAIIDEADSVLIDEAVTPLIISGDAPNKEQIEAFKQAAAIARELKVSDDYRINQRYREIDLTSAGRERVVEMTADLGSFWAGARRREELITQALTARELYVRGKQYVVQDDKIVIVDEFTGRLMPERTWRDGLHQAIEAKEAVTVNPPKDTLARVSFQRFFRMYRHVSGMTGTAWESKLEMWQIYQLPTVVIPTHKPCIRKQHPDRIFATAAAKWRGVVEEIKRVHTTGRPILVGTRSVKASELLSEMLTAENLEHQVLNAIKHAEEAQIVAQAGGRGRITVATNMAGRGTDIKMQHDVIELGGLHVIAAERHESGRVDRQLFGRAGRQGDPGTAVAFVSMEDELPQRYSTRYTRWLTSRINKSADELHGRMAQRLFDLAQRRAQHMAYRQRKAVLKSDDWLDEFLGFTGKDV